MKKQNNKIIFISPAHPNDGEVAYYDLALIRVYKTVNKYYNSRIIFDTEVNSESFCNYILSLNPSIIVINPYRYNLIDSVSFIKYIIKHIPDCIVILCGWYAESSYLRNYIRNTETLYLICGEIEELLPDIIIKILTKKNLNPTEKKYFTRYSDNTSAHFYINKNYQPGDNTGNEQYLFQSQNIKTGWIEISRGCRFACSFCIASSYNHKTYRKRPIKYIEKDIYELYERGVREFCILSSAINYDYVLMKNVFDIMKKLDEEVFLSGTIHPLFINKHTIPLIKSVRWRTMIMGLQTINPTAQIYINRRMEPELFSEKILQITDHHTPEVEIILGLPGDNEEGFKKTVRYLLSLP
ncbi:MAG: radical SAM protein, partial [Deltaproteobacteria bacterium]|nr:radical SAM protein [Deltaproteobacteria bacterium]